MSEENPFNDDDKEAPVKKNRAKKKSLSQKKKLTVSQKNELKKLVSNGETDIMNLTREIFQSPHLDGRSYEAGLIRQWLIDNSIEYETRSHKKLDEIVLTDEQKEFIEKQSPKGLKPLQIAQILFGNAKIKSLSREHRAVNNYIKSLAPEDQVSDDLVEGDYKPPTTYKQMFAKVKEIADLDIEEGKENTRIRRNIEKALSFAKNRRFLMFANSLKTNDERMLFEAEFIGAVWDKPDLTRDEINLTINLCEEYIKQLQINKYVEILNEIMANVTEDKDGNISMSIIQNISKHREELKNSLDMQLKINRDLNGTRSKRIESKKKSSRSISQMIEFVQEEKNRGVLEEVSKMKKQLLKKEMDSLADSDDVIARVFGVNQNDILEWE